MENNRAQKENRFFPQVARETADILIVAHRLSKQDEGPAGRLARSFLTTTRTLVFKTPKEATEDTNTDKKGLSLATSPSEGKSCQVW